MPAIVTITFSPCIDRSASVANLMPEKKLRCSQPVLEPGGGGINVARAIRKLGGEASAIYPAGGYTGHFFTSLLEREEIPAIVIETQHETRENIIILDESTGGQYRFGMPGTALKRNEWEQILIELEKIKGVEYIVASGSLPPGVPADIFARIAAIARKKKIKLVVDTSGEALKQVVEKGVFLLKPNLGELSFLVDKNYLQEDEVVLAARQIIQKGKCEVLVVSMGAAGAMLVTKDIAKNIVPPPVERKSTVGAGDSMVAGIVWSLLKGKCLEESVMYGVAAGTAATLNAGTELCRKKDTDRIFDIIFHGTSKQKRPLHPGEMLIGL